MTFALQDVTPSDYALLVEMMRDPESRQLAAFGTKDDDPAAMEARWRAGGSGPRKLIVADNEVVGFAATFMQGGETHVTYWVKRSRWGLGYATRALRLLLAAVDTRPLYASAWAGNAGSLRVLEKCGFVRTHEEMAFAAARGEEVVEVFFELRSPK